MLKNMLKMALALSKKCIFLMSKVLFIVLLIEGVGYLKGIMILFHNPFELL